MEELKIHFNAPLDGSPIELGAYLEEACGDDLELRARVEALIAGDRKAGEGKFMEEEPFKDGGYLEIEDERAASMIGNYRLLEKLGEGGIGGVWMAEQIEPVKRRVALKIIKLGMDTRQVVSRFEAVMDHPSIARVLDAGATATGRPYFVMELVQGVPITEYCDEQQLNTKDRLGLFLKICHAVQHAHQKGIIHRDLKPSNILVAEHDGMPVPKVIDFGIAKATQGQLTDETILTKFQQFIGTPSYMSPEQAKMSGADIDTRSDVYSLGVLLYELLTGSPPFESRELLASGLGEMHKIISEKNPVRPSTRINQRHSGTRENRSEAERDEVDSDPSHPSEASRLPLPIATDLDWIVMKCLEKDRTRRYDTASGLAMDLGRHLDHEPIVARPPSKVYRLQKVWQRNKLVFSAAAAVALGLIIGIAVASWQATVATHAEEQRALEAKNALSAKAELEKIAEKRQHDLARQLLLRGQALCEREKVASGLHWMVRAIQETPSASVALKRAIENNLVAWSQRWVEPDAVFLHDTYTHTGAFSPDGQHVITGGSSGWLSLWSTSSEGQVWPPKKAPQGTIRQVGFNADGTRILAVDKSKDSTARLWDASGNPVGQPMPFSGYEGAVAFSPDGKRVLVGGKGNAARVYSAKTGEPISPPLPHELPPDLPEDPDVAPIRISSVAFSPNGSLVLTASDAGTVKIWNAATGEAIGPVLHHPKFGDVRPVAEHPHGGLIWKTAFGPKGEMVAIGHHDGTVRVWSVRTGGLLFPALRHHGSIAAVAFHPDGDRLLTASKDHTALLWSTETGEPIGKPMRHDSSIYDAAFSPDGGSILTAGGDATVRLWSAQTGESLGPPMRHKEDWVLTASFSSEGKHILSTNGPQVYLWNVGKVTARPNRAFEHVSFGTITAGISPNSKLVAAGLQWPDGPNSGRVMIFDAATGQAIPPDIAHKGGVSALTFSSDSRHLVTGGRDGSVRF